MQLSSCFNLSGYNFFCKKKEKKNIKGGRELMTVKVGINGFGRVAKACLRASLQHQDVEVVAVNSIRDPNLLAHLLKYDTVRHPGSGCKSRRPELDH